MLKKNNQYQWTPGAATTFHTLQEALIHAPVLAVPDFSKQFIVETDACGVGIGAVLMQHDHPIAYLSKALCPKNQALSTYEKECLAILLAIDKWRSYLQHQEFIIRTDQKSLLHLTEQRLTTGIQHKAFVKLMGLNYKIQYKRASLMQQLIPCPDGSTMILCWQYLLWNLLGYKFLRMGTRMIRAPSNCGQN
jgi:hypothetical protein